VISTQVDQHANQPGFFSSSSDRHGRRRPGGPQKRLLYQVEGVVCVGSQASCEAVNAQTMGASLEFHRARGQPNPTAPPKRLYSVCRTRRWSGGAQGHVTFASAMTSKADDRVFVISRRDLLKTAGIVGAAAATGSFPFAQTRLPQREPLETLTSAEADTLEAIVARLIPSDANGPGAAEARAAHYIERALAGALASSRQAYRDGLLAADAYARASKGAPFARLSAADQDAVLRDMENDVATGFTPSAAAFFNLVRAHTIQGTFCDPYYGGNASFVGWDLIGYPGVRLAVTANDQRLNANVSPTRRSAYDHAMFSKKKPLRARLQRGMPRGG
jgi:gluconate 2-dehydrogenase gamma chain